MRKIIKSLIVLSVSFFIASPGIAGGPNDTGYISSADVLSPFNCANLPADCNNIGTSTLYRTAAGVGVNIHAVGLMPNTPHTVWMAAFNNPNACAAFPHGPCVLGDLGNPAAQATLMWTTGNYTDEFGNGFFQAFITDGPTSRQQPAGLPSDPGGLVNPNKAEIHFILRKHPIVFGEEYVSINSVGGACDGPGGCDDIASATHQR